MGSPGPVCSRVIKKDQKKKKKRYSTTCLTEYFTVSCKHIDTLTRDQTSRWATSRQEERDKRLPRLRQPPLFLRISSPLASTPPRAT